MPRAAGDDGGAITIWLLGLCVMILFVGGLSLDLWRVLGERSALAGIADSAALAAATAIDEDAYRREGVVVLDPEGARQRALGSLAGQPDTGLLTDASATTTPELAVVTVDGAVPLTLMRLLLPGEEHVVRLRVRASAGPQLVE